MKASIDLDCVDLEPGETRRMVCPSCGGGRSGERSLNVTRTEEGGLLYLCWRASCDVRGAIGGSPVRIAKLADRPKTFVRTKPDPSSRLVDMFSTDDPGVPTGWECDDEQLSLFGVKYDPETQRLALPVYSPVGAIRGWVLRQVGGGRGPKVLAVPTLNEPQLGWNPYQSTSADVIVVEDIPSVIRLGEFNVRAVALNGTHLTDEACEELAAEAERVVFALDRDAFRKSVALEQKLRIHFDKTATLLLPKDFKNQTNEEVETCLSEISWLAFSNPEKLSIESVVS